tara:strand:+ start:390 stop:569 length:180 start_codon:yes stop_codon:yes gene_type:complete
MAYPTNPIYKFVKDLSGNNAYVITQRDSKTLHIPPDSGNRHNQEYLEWVNAGNTAEEAD